MSFHHKEEPPELDIDRARDYGERLEQSLRGISLARLRMGVENAAALPQLRGTFKARADVILPMTLLLLLDSLRRLRAEMAVDERLLILHEQDVEKLTVLAAADLLDRRDVFCNTVLEHATATVAVTWDALAPADAGLRQEMLDEALTFVAYAQYLGDDYHYEADVDNVAFLLQQGANPNAHDGVLWQNVLKDANPDMCQLFLKHGADIAPLYKLAQTNRHYESILADAPGDITMRPLYAKANATTLVETTPLLTVNSKSTIVTIYRFDLGRAIEITTMDGSEMAPLPINFRDIPAATLHERHAELTRLGGHPPPLQACLQLPGSSASLRLPKK